MIDVSSLRLRAHVRSVADDRAIVNMETWNKTIHYASGCAWLSIPPYDPDIQCGTYRTTEHREGSRSQQQTSRRIAFERAYAAPPTVLVWLNAVDCGEDRNVRVNVYADGIAREGFTMHLDAWDDSQLFSAGASWLAYSADRRDIRSGAFEINDVRPSYAPRLQNRGRVSWGAPRMAKPPRVFAALRMLDFGHGRNVRLHLRTEEITQTGMTWRMDSWMDTVFYQAGGIFLAFEDKERA